jgi:hypothetical protein
MNQVMQNLFAYITLPSLESLVGDGGTVLEREYEIYGKLNKEEFDRLLQHGDFEHQEQWGMAIGKYSNIRVRRTESADGKVVYTQTMKKKTDEGNQENEMEVSEDTFTMFRSMIEKGLIKTRFIYPVEGTELKLEVDAFKDLEGNYVDTVKIDLEVPEGTDVSAIRIPFDLSDVRVIKPGKKTEDDLTYVRKLFSEKYEIVNPDYASA